MVTNQLSQYAVGVIPITDTPYLNFLAFSRKRSLIVMINNKI